jgi:hypothetical protein
MDKEREKKLLLKVATPEDWDKWLNKMADLYAPNTNNYDVIAYLRSNCLFCVAFSYKCNLCQYRARVNGCPPIRRCLDVPMRDSVDAAIARLKEVGLWNEEEGV